MHLVLGDDRRVLEVAAGLGLALDRQVLGERLARDHDGGGVDAVLAAQALQPAGDVDDPLGVGVALVERPELGRHLVAVLVALHLLEAGAQRRVAAHDQRRHELGDLVAHPVRVAEHPGRVAHRGPGLDRRERHDLGDVVPAVLLGGVADHLAPVALVEVHVDVGHLLAAGVEEPLEQQVVADRVDVDDAQAVSDARARRAPPPGPDPDAALLGVPHEVPHDEEVGGEAHVLDDPELELDPLRDLGGQRLAVALAGAGERELAEVRVLVVAGRRRERRQLGLAELDLDVRRAPRSAGCCRTPPRSRRTDGASRPRSSGRTPRRRT